MLPGAPAPDERGARNLMLRARSLVTTPWTDILGPERKAAQLADAFTRQGLGTKFVQPFPPFATVGPCLRIVEHSRRVPCTGLARLEPGRPQSLLLQRKVGLASIPSLCVDVDLFCSGTLCQVDLAQRHERGTQSKKRESTASCASGPCGSVDKARSCKPRFLVAWY